MSDDPADRCTAPPGCITCGDAAVAMRVVRVGTGGSALCADDADADATEDVACDLVWPVGPGDRVLVHAGVAIGRLDEVPE